MDFRAFRRTSGLVLATLLLAAARPASAQLLGPTGEGVNRALGVRAGFGARVSLAASHGGRMLVAVDAGSARGVLVLDPVDVRGEGYRLIAEQADGSYVDAHGAQAATFRGALLGAPASVVAASVLPDGLSARVLLGGGTELWIEPMPAAAGAPGGASHAIYRGKDVLDPGGSCALEALADAGLHAHGAISGAGGGGTGAAGGLKEADLACDADYEYFSRYGTVAAVEARIQTVINAMNVQYETEVGITHAITTIIVRTSPSQPYTSTDPNTLLNQFRTQWTTSHGSVTRDVAHLFTGKELDGSVIGIAWLGVICNSSYGYGLVQSDFTSNFAYSTDLSAHELGHNWNANHCSCPSYTMNPYITGANHFDPASSIPPITAHRDAVGCLADAGGDPPPPPDPNTGLASADYSTPSGTITAGTYASTHVSDDAYESIREVQSGGKPNTRYSLLEHVWTLAVPPGHNYSFAVEAHHTANSEADDFPFSWSLDNATYAPMVTVSKTADDDAAQAFVFPVDVTGTLYVKVRDTDHTVGKKVLDSVHVDRMAVLVDVAGPDLTPPAKPLGLTAQAGNAKVTLDWADSNAQDLAGYVVSRSTTSGGPYVALGGMPVASSAHVDTTASNGVTYYYVVAARDLAGNLGAASSQASATPLDPNAPATTMHVQQVLVTTVSVSAGWKQGRADVLVVNEHGNPVSGAVVTGAFSGGLNQTASGTTGADGVAVLTTFQTAKGSFPLTFCVTGITKSPLIYVSGQDVQTCASK